MLLQTIPLIGISLDATKFLAWVDKPFELAADDAIHGCVHLRQGFSVIGETGTIVLNTCGVVDGLLRTRAGDTIKIEHDLTLGSHVKFEDSVALDGCGNMVRLMANLEIPENRSLTILSDTTLDGQGCTLTLPSAHSLIVEIGATLKLKNINVVLLSSDALLMKGSSASLSLENATLTLKTDQVIKSGAVVITNEVVIRGKHVFHYASESPLTIKANAMLYLDNGVTFNYNPSVARRDLIVMEDESAALYLNGCTLSCTTTGLSLTKGTVFVDHKNIILNSGAVSLSESIQFGDGNPAHDLTVEILPGASLEVQSGILNYNNTF